MKMRSIRATRALGLVVLAGLASLGACKGDGATPTGTGKTTPAITGDTTTVSGATISTFANLASDGSVDTVGIVLPLAVVESPPTTGTGPAGAFAVLAFPSVVQSTTMFNHVELDWNPMGHPPPLYLVPHFDFHFFDVPVADVLAVTPPDPAAPAPDRVPPGYFYPGQDQTVPQMGTHAISARDAACIAAMSQPQGNEGESTDACTFDATMIVGFYAGDLTFLEPMVTQARLLQRSSFSLDVPMPKTFGRSTLYPTSFEADYDASTDAYALTFGNFVAVH